MMMRRLLNIEQQLGAGWRVIVFLLAAVVVALLIWQGLHPVWGILLFIYRKAAIRVCIFLILLYWLTHGII